MLECSRPGPPVGLSTFCFLLLPFHCLCFSRAPSQLPSYKYLCFFFFFFFSFPPHACDLLISASSEACRAVWRWLTYCSCSAAEPGGCPEHCSQWGCAWACVPVLALSGVLTVFHWSAASSSILMLLPGFPALRWAVFPGRMWCPYSLAPSSSFLLEVTWSVG